MKVPKIIYRVFLSGVEAKIAEIDEFGSVTCFLDGNPDNAASELARTTIKFESETPPPYGRLLCCGYESKYGDAFFALCALYGAPPFDDYRVEYLGEGEPWTEQEDRDVVY